VIAPIDFKFVGIPWKDKGRARATGVDCAGLAALFLVEELGIALDVPAVSAPIKCEEVIHSFHPGRHATLLRGDLLFFKNASGEIRHVAIHLGDDRWLHIVQGCESRIDNGLKLMRRLKLYPAGWLAASETRNVVAALGDPKLGWVQVVLLVISIGLAVASYALQPKLSRQGNKYGRYGFDALVTQQTPEIPLADLVGAVVVAGNSPYTSQAEKGAGGTASSQKANKVVILGSAPFEEIDYQTGLKINGLSWSDKYFKDGTAIEGIYIDPAQTKDAAVTGTIGADSNVPSVSLYTGAHGITVPVDVRAQYDREFPIYGFSGCGYLVFRLIDSTKFQNFNVTCRVKGRKCRTFNTSGFIVTTASGESLTGADGTKVRFKLAFEDVISVSSLTVNGTGHSEISAGAQTGNVYQLNRTKGYVEFLTAPAAAATITITYTYYPRAWTQNPASQLVYVLTEAGRGKGFDGSRIDWDAAVDMRDYCDADVTWSGANGSVTEDRYRTNYAIDFRKPIQEHIQAILDGCNGSLFLSGGKFVMVARTTGSSVFSFTEATILADSFDSEMLDRSERANRIKLLFHSDESHNAETEVIADDLADQRAREDRMGNLGVVEANLKLPAVTIQTQAERLAESALREQVGLRWMVEFTANIKGLALQPQDVIDVTHSSQPAWSAKLFRIDHLSHDENDRLVIQASEYVESAPI
jgi:hypothetical protein